MPEHGLGHQRRDDRRRVGEPGGLDRQAIEARHQTPLAPAEQIAHRVREIAPDGAADAAALQDHGLAVNRLEQKVVEADLAELVDQDCGVGELRRSQKSLQERGLARAEEARDQVDREKGRVFGHARSLRSVTLERGDEVRLQRITGTPGQLLGRRPDADDVRHQLLATGRRAQQVALTLKVR